MTETARKEAVKEESAAVFLNLVEVQAGDNAPLRFVDNTEEIVSNGNTYYPCAFRVLLPKQTEDGTSEPCKLEIDNTDLEISKAIKTALNTRITISVSVALAQTPNVMERGPLRYALRNIVIGDTITGDLYDFYVYDRKIPEGVYNPQNFPGLF